MHHEAALVFAHMHHSSRPGTMQSYLASWIVVCGMAIAVTGCALVPFNKTPVADNANHNTLRGQPATRDGVMRVGPTTTLLLMR